MTRSLRLTLLIFVATGLLLPALLSLAVLHADAEKEADRQIKAQLDQYAEILAFGAQDPLWNMNPESVRPLVDALLNNPDVVYVTIRDQTTGALLTRDRRAPSARVRYATRTVRIRTRMLGSIEIGVTGESLLAHKSQQIGVLTNTLLIQLALAAALVFVLLRRKLIEPLEKLGLAADALALGRLDQPIPQLGENEIGRLGLRLESTRRELVSLFAHLEDQNKALARELGERERADRARRESEAKFIALFEHAPVPLLILDVEDDATIIDLNTTFAAEFGISREDCRGQPLASLNLWATGEDQQRFAALLEGLNQGKIETWVHARQGLICCDIAGSHMQIRGRHHFVWSAIDVTPIIRAKQEVDDLNLSLERKVADRTRALEQSKQELEQSLAQLRLAQHQLVQSEKLAALGALVAGIAHELNTPIGNCLMVASALEDERNAFQLRLDSGLSRKALNTYLAMMREGNDSLIRNLGRAADLVTSFKQVAVDQTSSQRRRFDLAEVVREIEITLGPTLRRSLARFHSEVPPGLEMDSFPGPLGQVLTNLANNAVTHGFEGRSEGGNITISAQRLADARIRLCIADDGRGIPAADLPRIFDPFFTTRLGKGGSGLGLHIVYNIVTGILGGSIEVETPQEGGCRFCLNLPCQAPPGAAGAP